MLVERSGEVTGSISGGCVEGAVHELAREALESGEPGLHRFGVSDDDAFAVGLTCGGILDVFIEVVDRKRHEFLGELYSDIARGVPVAVAAVIESPLPNRVGRRMLIRAAGGPENTGGFLGHMRLDAAVRDDARGLLASGTSQTLTYGPDGQRRGDTTRVFVSSFAPAPRMLVFGAIDFAAAVARQGKLIGYDVTVCDARPVFATTARFPDADRVVVDWPHRYMTGEAEAGRIDAQTVICVLTHDPKFDVPLLEVVLRLPALAYVGAMGSRRTHEDRERRLREAGVSQNELARLSSPIGLDLGARTPEETAVSIVAEIIASRWNGSAQRLSSTAGPIHSGLDRSPPSARTLVS